MNKTNNLHISFIFNIAAALGVYITFRTMYASARHNLFLKLLTKARKRQAYLKMKKSPDKLKAIGGFLYSNISYSS